MGNSRPTSFSCIVDEIMYRTIITSMENSKLALHILPGQLKENDRTSGKNEAISRLER